MTHSINLTHNGTLIVRVPKRYKVNKVRVEEIGTDKTVDYESVVRCKDCKYWFTVQSSHGCHSCEHDAMIRYEDFYCAYGRKENRWI